MRSKTLIVFTVIFTAVPWSFGSNAAPVNCAHLLGWLAGDAPTYSLTRAVKERGSSITLTPRLEAELRAAGAAKDLLSELRRSQQAST
ncbi:MAG TPA: hypothetical protein VIG91_02280, partial [Terriglobales bacterium]